MTHKKSGERNENEPHLGRAEISSTLLQIPTKSASSTHLLHAVLSADFVLCCWVASGSQGDGDGVAAGERLLVPADPQNGQVQARQEEAAVGQARRHQLIKQALQ
uniref:Uncharacterized protein n=1 Tax=Arundo donax TaxID=35708 RepID=A0A0A9BQ80_ARUDO